MRLLAGLCAGLFVYLSLGAIVGITPRFLERLDLAEASRVASAHVSGCARPVST